MKTPILLGIIFMALSSLSFADLKIPRSAFRMDQLEEAKTKAAEEEKPLIFVYTNPGST